MPTLKELVGLNLSNFKVIEMTEVYRTNEDGNKSSSVGFFKNPNIAQGFAEAQTDSSFHKTASRYVLTDDFVGYVLGEKEAINLFDDETEALNLRKQIAAKLSPAQRKILGLV